MFHPGILQEANPYYEIDVFFGIEQNPSFVSIILDKEKYSVTISLNEPENEFSEIRLEDNVEIIKVVFESLGAASNYYTHVRNPMSINNIVKNFKSKEQ